MTNNIGMQITIRKCANGFMIYSNKPTEPDYIANNQEELNKTLETIFNKADEPETIPSPYPDSL